MTTNQEELQRLLGNAFQAAPPGGYILYRLRVACDRNAQIVLAKCKEVLGAILTVDPNRWPSLDEWRLLLPRWFVDTSAEEITQEEAERRLRLPLEERRRLSERWSVSAFVHWFQPEERYWYWWDAVIEDVNTIRVSLIIKEESFPWAALDWLLRSSGALKVEEEG
jgi:hypothetical protein